MAAVSSDIVLQLVPTDLAKLRELSGGHAGCESCSTTAPKPPPPAVQLDVSPERLREASAAVQALREAAEPAALEGAAAPESASLQSADPASAPAGVLPMTALRESLAAVEAMAETASAMADQQSSSGTFESALSGAALRAYGQAAAPAAAPRLDVVA
ncbi:MAG: hypothetical protein AAF533_18660 [Acidobacteriota bacterium]